MARRTPKYRKTYFNNMLRIKIKNDSIEDDQKVSPSFLVYCWVRCIHCLLGQGLRLYNIIEKRPNIPLSRVISWHQCIAQMKSINNNYSGPDHTVLRKLFVIRKVLPKKTSNTYFRRNRNSLLISRSPSCIRHVSNVTHFSFFSTS